MTPSPAALRAAEHILQGVDCGVRWYGEMADGRYGWQYRKQADVAAIIDAETSAERQSDTDRQELIQFIRDARFVLAGRQRTPSEDALDTTARALLAKHSSVRK